MADSSPLILSLILAGSYAVVVGDWLELIVSQAGIWSQTSGLFSVKCST